MNPEKDQFDDHKCEACPDTSVFDEGIKNGPFKGWHQAAKDHAVASHKFNLAAENYLKNR